VARGRTDALAAVQRGLEKMYRVETGLHVEDFVVGEEFRNAVSPVRRPREQLLVCEDSGEMSIALFVDARAVDNLAAQHPSNGLGNHNVEDFLLALEGVSHFVYTVVCAQRDRQVSALELEVQAEVDKYVTCLLHTEVSHSASEYWRQRLFVSPEYCADLDDEEQSRYRVANDNALRYTGFLQRTFVAARKIPEMLAELRRFYRRGLSDKLAFAAAV
jgi:hypothetical protein